MVNKESFSQKKKEHTHAKALGLVHPTNGLGLLLFQFSSTRGNSFISHTAPWFSKPHAPSPARETHLFSYPLFFKTMENSLDTVSVGALSP